MLGAAVDMSVRIALRLDIIKCFFPQNGKQIRRGDVGAEGLPPIRAPRRRRLLRGGQGAMHLDWD